MPESYIAEYECQGCSHQYEVFQGGYGCPEGFVGESCGADDPAKCTVRGGCWGCSPCGRSRRRYRCAACNVSKSCPQCGHGITRWLNYESLFGSAQQNT